MVRCQIHWVEREEGGARRAYLRTHQVRYARERVGEIRRARLVGHPEIRAFLAPGTVGGGVWIRFESS